MIDLAAAITKEDANHAAQEVGYVKERHPEVTQILGDFKFRGQGHKKTPVTDLRGAVELTFLLPGRHAARVRRQAAELLCRYLGGDIALVDEICAPRAFQEQLAVRAQEDSRRLFGEAVEASSSSTSTQLANLFASSSSSSSSSSSGISKQLRASVAFACECGFLFIGDGRVIN